MTQLSAVWDKKMAYSVRATYCQTENRVWCGHLMCWHSGQVKFMMRLFALSASVCLNITLPELSNLWTILNLHKRHTKKSLYIVLYFCEFWAYSFSQHQELHMSQRNLPFQLQCKVSFIFFSMWKVVFRCFGAPCEVWLFGSYKSVRVNLI